MSNPYSLFIDLLPKDSIIIGKVISTESDGRVVVQIPGSSSQVTVRGDGSDTYAENDHVYIVNGIISGKTPVLQDVSSYPVI